MRLKQFLSRLGEANNKWPTPKFDENDQPHFLFILTPPYSGSTALSQLLNTSHKTMILQHRGEGQWLIPGLHESNRWDPEKYVNYESVKATWLHKYQEVKKLVGSVDIVIEKSPPNMMRIENISSQFRDCSFIANNRNPYANCSSILYRNHPAEKISASERKRVLTKTAGAWVTRSKQLQELIQRLKIPLLTYEQFCENPNLILEKLDLPREAIDSIDPGAVVNVKDYHPQGISNQNNRQISNLSASEIDEISVILSSYLPCLEFFGYEILKQ